MQAALVALADDPRPANSRPLVGRPDWRLRVGDYRVIYQIQDAVLVVTVIEVGHRKEIYR